MRPPPSLAALTRPVSRPLVQGATVDVETTTNTTPEGSAAGRFPWSKSYNLLRLFGILALICLGAAFAHSSYSATSALLSSRRYDSPWPTSPPATFAKSFTPAELDDEAYALRIDTHTPIHTLTLAYSTVGLRVELNTAPTRDLRPRDRSSFGPR